MIKFACWDHHYRKQCKVNVTAASIDVLCGHFVIVILADEGRIVTIEKLDEDASFGFHIKDNQPVIVSTVEEGSPAQRGGLQVGDVLIAVNEVNVLEASHQEVVKLMAAGKGVLLSDVTKCSSAVQLV